MLCVAVQYEEAEVEVEECNIMVFEFCRVSLYNRFHTRNYLYTGLCMSHFIEVSKSTKTREL